MSGSTRISSPCLDAEETRQLVLGVERLGVDTARIEVLADPAITTTEVATVDARAMTRPARRVGIGLAAGLVVGLTIAALALVMSDVPAAATLLSLGVAGSVIGGLVGLYSQLSMNIDLIDVDTGQEAMVMVEVDGLDENTAKAVDDLLRHR